MPNCPYSLLPHAHTAYVGMRQHTSAYVSVRQRTSAYVSIRQLPHAHTAPASHTTTTLRLQRQYLYFRTSKASKLSTCRNPHAPFCQYSYFCTSKASKLSTSAVLTHHDHMLLSAACETHGKRLQHLCFCTSQYLHFCTSKANTTPTCSSRPPARRTASRRRCSLYLLYWYKSTNTDASGACKTHCKRAAAFVVLYLSVFALCTSICTFVPVKQVKCMLLSATCLSHSLSRLSLSLSVLCPLSVLSLSLYLSLSSLSLSLSISLKSPRPIPAARCCRAPNASVFVLLYQ
jgi:hypothetical protein